MKYTRSIQRLIAAAALLSWSPLVVHAQEDITGSIENAGEAGARFQAVTDAVASDPEMAPEIVGSLVRNFPDAAAAIAASAVEGLPERNQENVNAIVEAAAEAAPDRREAIEAGVAGVAPELFAESEETAGAVDEGSADEAEGGIEPELVAEDEVIEPLPERLQREVDLINSLIATYPENAPSIARRSVARVADQEAFWTVTVVETALAAAPDQEEAIVRMAILEGPQYEAEIREAVGWDPAVEEEPVDETSEPELPERLRREVELLTSLVQTYPANAGVATRRSIERVADEEASWSVALLTVALENSPDLEDEIVREAIAAAPHHEAEILDAVGREADETVAEVATEDEPVEEAGPFQLEGVVEHGELRDNLYYVRLEMRGAERSLRRRMVESLELRVSPERYFDPYEGRYLERNAAVITGDDIVGLAFKLVPGDGKQSEGIAAALSEFERKVGDAREFIERKREAGEVVLLGDHRVSLGSVYLYPSRREVEVEMHADFNDERYLMRIGTSITVSPETAGAIRHLIENLERYNEEFKELIEMRERQGMEFLDFSRAEPVEVEVDEEDDEDGDDAEAGLEESS